MSLTSAVITDTGGTGAALATTGINLNTAKGCGYYISCTIATAAAKTFTAVAATDICTSASHGFYTGLRCAASNVGGALPAGLSVTNYWITKIDATTYKLASTAANAIIGVAVDITGAGTGTHTLTPSALTGGAYKLQASPDNVLWFDLPAASSANNVTVTATFMHEKVDPMYNFIRVLWACTTGQIIYTILTLTKE